MNTSSKDSFAARTIACPACGGKSVYAPTNTHRPFCSQRCKVHDLGAWASEDFKLEDQSSEMPEHRAD